jgi:hypothetical protein
MCSVGRTPITPQRMAFLYSLPQCYQRGRGVRPHVCVGAECTFIMSRGEDESGETAITAGRDTFLVEKSADGVSQEKPRTSEDCSFPWCCPSAFDADQARRCLLFWKCFPCLSWEYTPDQSARGGPTKQCLAASPLRQTAGV